MHDIFKELGKYLDPVANAKAVKKARWEAFEKLHGDIEETQSNCCGAKIVFDDLCKDCREHCGKVYVFTDGFTCDEDGNEID